jgi:hypothetical protein
MKKKVYILLLLLSFVVNFYFYKGIIFLVPILLMNFNNVLKESLFDLSLIFFYFFLSFLGLFLNSDFNTYFIFVFTPIIFFLASKSISNFIIEEKTFFILSLFIILSVFVLSNFLLNRDGLLSFSIEDNLYYSSRVENYQNEIVSSGKKMNTTLIAPWLSICFSICLVLFKSISRWFFIFATLFLFLIFLSLTRSQIFISFFILFVFLIKERLLNFRILLFSLLFFLIIFFNFETYEYYSVIQNRFQDDIGRWDIWELGFDNFNFFIGKGHTFFYDKYGFSTHNDIIGQLVSIGIFASIFFYLFLYLSFTKLIVSKYFKEKNSLFILFFLIFIVYFFTGLVEQINYSNIQMVNLLFICCGVLSNIKK